MRRTTGAILIETRPERISRSAWRGRGAEGLEAEARDVDARRRRRTSSRSRSRRGRSVHGKIELPRAQTTALSSVVVRTRSSTYGSSVVAVEVAAAACRGPASWRPRSRWCELSRRERRARGSMRLRASPPFEGSSAPDVDEGHEQQHDEDDRLAPARTSRTPAAARRSGRGRSPRCRTG